VLVGHDIGADIQYLRRLGYDPHNLSNLQELVDTASMYRAFRQEPNPRNLGSILADLDLSAWYLHNAGNDAVYTLHVMIGIAIQAMIERQEEKAKYDKELALKVKDGELVTCCVLPSFLETHSLYLLGL
jgi:DNA polymerase III alpha subunit (gram-positive type)